MKNKLFTLAIFFIIFFFAETTLAQFYYCINDHLGNTRVVVDEQGNVKEYYDYYPFGKTLRSSITDQAVATYKFTGKELDDENDLSWYYFGARYYDAGIGRFLSVDRFADKYPSLTPYHYAINNPLKYIDVNGDTIDTSQLNDKQLVSFNNELQELLKSDKFRKIWETLSSSPSIYKIQLNSKQGAGAMYQPSSNKTGSGGTLSFKNIEALTYYGTFSHESYHAYQHDQAWPGSVVGAEIEANLFQNAVSMDLFDKGVGMGMMMLGGGGNQAFEKAFQQLQFGSTFNQQAWVTANKNFHAGGFNLDARYNKMGVRIYNPLIRKFYPLVK